VGKGVTQVASHLVPLSIAEDSRLTQTQQLARYFLDLQMESISLYTVS